MKKLTIPDKISTERLVLRKHQNDDSERMFKTVDANREMFEEFLPWVASTKTEADSKAYIKLSLKNWTDSISFDFSILVKDSDLYIGNIGLHTISLEHLRGEFGYWLDGSAQGKGYMIEAVKVFEDVCFAAGLNRLEIRCAPENKKSAAVPIKLNYQLDGRLRDNYRVNGRAQDTLVYSKIKSDLTS